MNLLPGENKIREAGDPNNELYIILTTHRIRMKQRTRSRAQIISMMLDEVASCSIAQRSSPWIIAIGALLVLGSLILASQDEKASSAVVAAVIIAAV